MTKIITTAPAGPAVVENDADRFARILARPPFKPLKDVIDKLEVPVALLHGALLTTNSYPMFLSKLGYRCDVVKQIHESDCYSRLGPKGGIRAVLPLHDTATYSTLVTLVNYDSTVTTTANAVVFYERQLADFKTQVMSKTGNIK